MPTLAPVAHFQIVQLTALAIAARTALPNRMIVTEEGESTHIPAVAPMPIMMANVIAAVPADHTMIALATLGNIAVKASITAT